MRLRRYVPLGLAVAATLAGLAWTAEEHADALARERANGLRDALEDRIAELDEEARYVARLPREELATYLTYFRGVARVHLHDEGGRPLFRVERFDDYVATPPPKPEPPPPPGFAIDDERLDVEPARRAVYHLRAPRPAGGTLSLTVYAGPLLRPLHAADGVLLADGQAAPPQHATAAGAGWRVAVPVAGGRRTLLALLAVAVVLLGGATVLLSERQLRAHERAELERGLAQRERLSSVGLLAAGIAHEINNPLEGIANWLRLGNVEKAQEGFERIRTIVRDLLAFARPDAGPGTAGVRAALDRALELARFANVFRGVDARCDVAPGLRVQASPRLLEQVFLNVLLNAGGAGARRVEIDAVRTDDKVRLGFTDDGPGIAAADLPRIFDPFFSRSGGTGLGLSVSYGMVKAAGGHITAGNAPGKGARFTVELPSA